ncbi:hypothetical protein, partial [Enterobacter asburiae]
MVHMYKALLVVIFLVGLMVVLIATDQLCQHFNSFGPRPCFFLLFGVVGVVFLPRVFFRGKRAP